MVISHKDTVSFSRVFEILDYQSAKYPNTRALNHFAEGQWYSFSIQQIQDLARTVSGWFINKGFAPGEKVMLIPHTGNAYWVILDFACQMAGLITVPVHPNLRVEDIALIGKETGSRLCITADEELYQKVVLGIKYLPQTISLFTVEPGTDHSFPGWSTKDWEPSVMTELMRRRSSISEKDVHTILYTSGSTGIPKGVMLTHENVCFNVRTALMLIPLEPHHRVISFLPFSHIFERASCYAYMAFGVSVYFSKSRETFASDFLYARPYFCTCVPRVLEKMYDYLLEQAETRNWLKRKIILKAIEIGKQYQKDRQSLVYKVNLLLARWLVLRTWRKALGGRIRYMAVGAASLRPELARLFSAAGIRIMEGYGMTETAPTISMNRYEPGMSRFGTVGLPLPGTEVRIDKQGNNDEGEILVKGPHVMAGYFLHPDLTARSFTEDGWFRTGDVGRFVERKFLQITDRKRDIFKTSSGEFIAPLQLQNHFMRSPFIGQCMVLGFQRPYVTALIVPNFSLLEKWCGEMAIHWTSGHFMVHNIKVLAKYKSEVEELNKLLPNFQRIRDFILCPEDWTMERGELTATLKPVRQTVLDHYATQIEKLYAESHN